MKHRLLLVMALVPALSFSMNFEKNGGTQTNTVFGKLVAILHQRDNGASNFPTHSEPVTQIKISRAPEYPEDPTLTDYNDRHLNVLYESSDGASNNSSGNTPPESFKPRVLPRQRAYYDLASLGQDDRE